MLVQNDKIYFYHNDHRGAPESITSESGAVVWDADYASFGKALINHGEIKNNLRLPGQYYDEETGLHYNWNRYYDPFVGRYLTADPIGLAGGINVYNYCMSDPVNFFDIDGLERKPGKTPPKSWPIPHPDIVGKKPRWNPKGYWNGKNGRKVTWDDRSHGAGVDRGEGKQGGHWDDENSDNRWDEDGHLLPGSPDLPPKESASKKCERERSKIGSPKPEYIWPAIIGYTIYWFLRGGPLTDG